LVKKIRKKFKCLDKQGVAPIEIVDGIIDSDARVLGAASLPILAGFSPHRDFSLGRRNKDNEGQTKKPFGDLYVNRHRLGRYEDRGHCTHG
jgi:hypothetical protein